MVNSKRLTALLLSAVLIGSAVYTPVMAAEVPTGETAEVSVSGKEQSEPAAEGNSETIAEENTETIVEENSDTAENEDAVSEATQEVAEPSQDNESVASENETDSKEQNAATGSTEEKDSEEIAPEQEVPATDSELTTEDDAEQSASAAEEATAVAPVEQAVSDDAKLENGRPGNFSFDTAKVITIGEGNEETITYTGLVDPIYYKFIPDKTGPYAIYSICDDNSIGGDIIVFDENQKAMGSFLPSEGDYKNAFEKDKVYYLRVYSLSDVDYKLGIKSFDFFVKAGEDPYIIEENNQVTFSVDVYGSDQPNYQWTDSSGKELIGENNKAEYTFTPEEAGIFTYYCHVSDGINDMNLPVNLEVWHTNNDSSSAIQLSLGERVAIPRTGNREVLYYSFTP